MYTIYYQQIQPRGIGEPWYQVNLTDVMATKFTISLSCDTQYTIEISAWNELGESDRSRPLIIKTIAGTLSNISSDNVSRRVEKCWEDPSDQVRQTDKVGFCANCEQFPFLDKGREKESRGRGGGERERVNSASWCGWAPNSLKFRWNPTLNGLMWSFTWIWVTF